MEYRELLRILLRRWWLIALPVVLAAVFAIPDLAEMVSSSAAGFRAEVRFSAAQKMNLVQRDGDYTDIWRASEHTVDALTDWAGSASFRQEIRAQLAEAAPQADGLGIAADNVRNVGAIYFSHHDSGALREIVDSALIVLANRSQTYFPQLGGEAALVTILDPATVTAAPAPLSDRLAPLIQLGIGLLAGLALAFLAEVLDPTIYHQDDLRRMGLTLLGSIPGKRA